MPHTNREGFEERFDEQLRKPLLVRKGGVLINPENLISTLRVFIKQEIERAREEERKIVIKAVSNLPLMDRAIYKILESLTPPEST